MLRFILALALAVVPLNPVTAAIFEHDDRVGADPAFDPAVRAIAQSYYGFRRGTAFLVDRCHAATSQHLVSMKRDPIGAHVSLRLFGNQRKVRGTVVDAGHVERRIDPGDYRQDWMLLRLESCFAKSAPTFALAFTMEQGNVASAGYPMDLKGAVVERNCLIRSFSFRGIQHDCAAYPGSSGSPIFVRSSSGTPVVVAIQAAGDKSRFPEPFRFDRANLAAPVADLAAALERDNDRIQNCHCDKLEVVP